MHASTWRFERDPDELVRLYDPMVAADPLTKTACTCACERPTGSRAV